MILLPTSLQQYVPELILGLVILSSILLTFLLIFLFKLKESRKEINTTSQLLNEYQEINSSLQDELTAQKIRLAKLLTILKSERRSHQEKIEIIEDAKMNLRLQFKELAQQIFDEKSERFGSENKERVSAILQPLQEQLHGFQQRIDTIQLNDVRERASLKEEIGLLRQLNQQINKEAANLTRALKGDKKHQGNWGELVLEKVLEKSGLRKGEEYSVQTGFRNSDNQLLKPDVVIHLPDRRDIVIDSKVSLLAWEKYINSDTENDRQRYLKEHIANIRNHIKGLSSKDYTDIKSLESLDFVLLFMPIDSAYVTATQADDALFTDAYEKRIIIVTPTTLLATLKTVENLWRYEQQSRNSKEIADRAGAIYDKLCSFLEEMEKIGKQLATCNTTYETALNRLAKGRGNLVSQAGKLTELGVKSKKKIPQSIEALSDTDIAN